MLHSKAATMNAILLLFAISSVFVAPARGLNASSLPRVGRHWTGTRLQYDTRGRSEMRRSDDVVEEPVAIGRPKDAHTTKIVNGNDAFTFYYIKLN